MNQVIRPAPVRRSVTVKAAPDKAFDVFARGIGRWWPKTHSIVATPPRDVILEPIAGGRWFEIGEDGRDCDWGRVLAIEPPRRLLLAWQINAAWAFDPDFVTEVEVRFTATCRWRHPGRDRASRSRALRRGRGNGPRHARSSNGWQGLADLFARGRRRLNHLPQPPDGLPLAASPLHSRRGDVR